MHRNDIRFHAAHANLYSVQAQVIAVVRLHTEWYSQELLKKILSHSSLNLRQLHALLDALRLHEFLPSGPPTLAIPPD